MATLTPTIKLESIDVTTDTLSLSVSDSLTVVSPMESVSRVTLTTSPTDLVPTASTDIVYFYAKNCYSTNVAVLETIAGTQAFSDLNPYEACFFPVKGTIGIRAKSAAGTAVLEFGYWTKG